MQFLCAAGSCLISSVRQNTANATVEEEITAMPDGWSWRKALGRAEAKCSGKCRAGMWGLVPGCSVPQRPGCRGVGAPASAEAPGAGAVPAVGGGNRTSRRKLHHLSEWQKFGVSASHPPLTQTVVSARCVHWGSGCIYATRAPSVMQLCRMAFPAHAWA